MTPVNDVVSALATCDEAGGMMIALTLSSGGAIGGVVQAGWLNVGAPLKLYLVGSLRPFASSNSAALTAAVGVAWVTTKVPLSRFNRAN